MNPALTTLYAFKLRHAKGSVFQQKVSSKADQWVATGSRSRRPGALNRVSFSRGSPNVRFSLSRDVSLGRD